MFSRRLFSPAILFLFCVALLNIEKCSSYRILAIFPWNGQSHNIMYDELLTNLAKRNHRVDVVSQYSLKNPPPNYHNITMPSLPELTNKFDWNLLENYKDTNYVVRNIATNFGNFICEERLKSSRLQEIIKNPPKNPAYDLVLVEVFSAHCFMAFGHHLNVPVVGVTSSAVYPWIHDMIANPQNLAYSSNILSSSLNPTSFWNRLYNTLHTFYVTHYFQHYTSPQTDIIKKYFGPDAPGVRELEKNVSLIIANSHLSVEGVKSTTPALVYVAGLNIQDNDKDQIAPDDKKWLDESSDGFIYFAFGSFVNFDTFPIHIIQAFFKSFEKVYPIRVFMKVTDENNLPPGLPHNTRTFSWTSQVKVLNHKNVKAFITHGGTKGIHEAIMYGVPMIAIPLFTDQFFNVDFTVNNNVAVKLNIKDISEQKLDNAFDQIMNNAIYRESMKKVSKKFRDRPISAMDTACYWIEYIIRNGGDALRSPAVDLSWWQVALLDVYGTIFLFFLFSFVILIVTVMFIIASSRILI
ncbi:UDP-glucuronosyl/UDP-glucosyltransferase [Cinara cedri]|uniref:UDP-glucuronosyltransferase n=1 Tax=Cinara cedri TaxID=506608 RepID=A0A5E4M382_9HEMI|nr:UDP-glucuronosyl/UDP-glucosyltransferase [Cinara cedri]